MKTTGGRDTFLLFIVVILAIGAVCYLFVIKKSLNKLKQAEAELVEVQQEKAEKDAIIEQAKKLDAQRQELKNSISSIEDRFIPELNSDAITSKLYKYFEDAGLKYIVDVENSEQKYETVTMPDGTANPNRSDYSSYTVSVSGTDGWLLTHEEAAEFDKNSADQTVKLADAYYEQLHVNDDKNPNKSLTAMGIDGRIQEIHSEIYVGYKEFVKALEELQKSAPGYVKVTDIKIEDQNQGFCYYTAVVNVYDFNLVKRLSESGKDLTKMDYMVWVGDENIVTGGLVGLPNYFTVANGLTELPEGHPLKDKFLSFLNFDFNVNRPFAAWNMWGYDWNIMDTLKKDAEKENPKKIQLALQFYMGKLTSEEYAKQLAELDKSLSTGEPVTGTPDDENANTKPAT
ncbi:MAG: hypothetical protein J6Z09_08805 [Lachnospiraceae bacterium]|nr:hypothetical protein [Lachnospiraceae bacterium]